jgi:MYXO-CTERM domain-containing protein
MRKLIVQAALLLSVLSVGLLSSHAGATNTNKRNPPPLTPVRAPELSTSAGGAALVVLLGAAAIVAARRKKQAE